jgi:ribosome-associated protein
MLTFQLDDRDHITLTNLLKIMRLTGSGGEANQFIANGDVLVNGARETQKRKKIRAGDVVEFAGKRIEVK